MSTMFRGFRSRVMQRRLFSADGPSERRAGRQEGKQAASYRVALAGDVAHGPVPVAVEVRAAAHVAPALAAVLGRHVRGALPFAVLEADLGSERRKPRHPKKGFRAYPSGILGAEWTTTRPRVEYCWSERRA